MVDHALDVIYTLISACDDCKQMMFCTDERLESFLEHTKKPTHIKTEDAPNPKPTDSKLALVLSPSKPKRTHEPANLKHHPSFSNPRIFTKSSVQPSRPPTAPLEIVPSFSGAGAAGTCNILPYLIRNLPRLMKSPKTLAKILSIFCIIAWGTEESLLLWYA